MNRLVTKENVGLIAILITFIGSEVILDYWLEMQSIITKCWFVFLVISIYYVIIEQFFSNSKISKK